MKSCLTWRQWFYDKGILVLGSWVDCTVIGSGKAKVERK
jgi:hypothetical protein